MEVLNFRGRSESFHFQGGGVCLFGGEVVSSGVHGQFKKQDYIDYIFIYVLVLFTGQLILILKFLISYHV